MSKFRRVVLGGSMGVAALLAIAPPWEGIPATGSSPQWEPIGHFSVFDPPTCESPRERQNAPADAYDEALKRLHANDPPWQRLRIAWVRAGCEFAALSFIAASLFLMSSPSQRQKTHRCTGAEPG